MSEPNPTPANSSYIPYQAYKPKRHSRNFSTSSRPPSTVVSPVSSPLPRVLVDEDRDSIPSFSLVNSYGTPPSTGFRPPTAPSPTILIDQAPEDQSESGPENPPRPESPASTSASQSSQSSPTVKSAKVTTFRRLTPRPLQPSLPPSSPTHNRNTSTLSLPAVSGLSSPRRLTSTRLDLDERPRTTTPQTKSASPRMAPPPPPPPTLIPMDASRSNSRSSPVPISATDSVSSSRKAKLAPYRPGFQPTGSFLAIRRLKRDGEGEEGRLMRLITLHFLPNETSNAPNPSHPSPSEKKEAARSLRRASSFFDFESIKNLKLNDPGDLWRGVINQKVSGEKPSIRSAEQRITPWEDDSHASKCPLCTASFHPLTNRKHHCRLCGRIICSLPPKMPLRPQTCSLLFFVDSKSKKIEEVGEGVDYGVRRKNRNGAENEDKFLRAVRICRTCRPVLMHYQYAQQVEQVPIFFKLYDVAITINLQRRLRLPENGYWTRLANTTGLRNKFARSHARTALSLPRPSAISAPTLNGKKAEESMDIDPDSALAQTLQPLLEQESLLESFIDEAKAQRKFEDVKSLKRNQQEIRNEIERLLDNADIASPTFDNSRRK
ncbi:hypothetical protein FA15DRAFT_677165 [Coprinopsis marcescibilis]|uniref:FYVE-type domain-containing protein n=1 Tax=Coprinopsis marcescibilis TaxID=230819 RepID=A0A5C3LM84_COPMA|nr:hypothetical protein FA15DRAFT_677165 [Coprinopsis marcescibilis]